MQQPVDHKQMFFKPGISATSINQYFESPLHFWKKSLFNPQRIKEPPTDAMIFGRLTHMMLLTPEDFNNDFAVLPRKDSFKGRIVVDTSDEMKQVLDKVAEGNPDFKYKKSSTKAELAQLIREHAPQTVIWEDELYMFQQTAGKRDIISPETYDQAKAMIDAALAHPSVKKLLGNGCSEEPLTWYREEGGLMCKAKLDYNRAGLVIDYKTGTDIENGHPDDASPNPQDCGLAKTIANYGYHRQMAWCMDGVEILRGERPRGAVIIAQNKATPEAVSVSALTTRALDIGNQENLWAYEQIKRRLAAWNAMTEEQRKTAWPAYHPELRGVDLPRWYKSPALSN